MQDSESPAPRSRQRRMPAADRRLGEEHGEAALLDLLARRSAEAEARIEAHTPGTVERMRASLNEAFGMVLSRRQRLGRRGARLGRQECVGRVRTPRRGAARACRSCRGPTGGDEGPEPESRPAGELAGTSAPRTLAPSLLTLHATLIARSAALGGESVDAYVARAAGYIEADDPALLPAFYEAAAVANGALS